MRNIFNILRFGGLLVLWIFSAINGSAQNGTIQGAVKDSSERQVQYVNVLLLNSSDSALVKGMISDSLGNYLFENISAGKYYIVASFLEWNRDLPEYLKFNREKARRHLELFIWPMLIKS